VVLPPSSLIAVAQEFGSTNGLSNIAFRAKGAYKETFRAETADGHVIALKILEPSKCDLARTAREIDALKKCNSPYIAKLYVSGQFGASDGINYYVSLEEFLDGGTLTDRLSGTPIPLSTVKNYAIYLVQALDHLKALNLVHRDIKPDNIMFRRGQDIPILVDFGLVRDLSAISLTQTWLPQGPGTPYYAAPEQLNNEKHMIGWRTDQFSLGIVLGMCLTGQHPFEQPGMNMPQTVGIIAARKPCSPQFRADAQAAGLGGIVQMLAPWPIQRHSTPARLLQVFQ